MKFSSWCVTAVIVSSTTVTAAVAETIALEIPFISPKVTLSGTVQDVNSDSSSSSGGSSGDFVLATVDGCCDVTSSNDPNDSNDYTPRRIGQMPQMNAQQTLQVLEDAKQAWKGGMGQWPQMTFRERWNAINNFLLELSKEREVMVQTLMWEIGKNRKDAEAEFDRTVEFCRKVMDVMESDPDYGGGSAGDDGWQTIGSTRALVRRAAIGIIMCLGPMNYPLNETYATLIPALLMGNVAIMKIPTVGGLVHLLTMEAFAKTLPSGAMNFVSGRGRDTMPFLMKTGDIDALAFIGGSKAADDLIRQHPQPHRLKVFLQLEAKNMGIFLPDLFAPTKETELAMALDQAILGALSFNGQRCTALKIFHVPTLYADDFAQRMAERVEQKSVGLPWETHKDGADAESYSSITPLPGKKRIEYMRELIDDAVAKGAKIMNKDGGDIIGGTESTLMVPAVLYPVTPDMRIYTEEQFGPIVPIAAYESLSTIIEHGRDGLYGQQVSIFVSDQETAAAADLVDKFSSIFGKININSQCGRSPDTLPFSGRRSSAMGVMSVKDALREFSIPTVVSYNDTPTNRGILQEIEASSKFMESM